jgi:hypothetical protein
MKCPHCTVTIHAGWQLNNIANNHRTSPWFIGIMTCPECHRDILQVGEEIQTNNGVAPPTEWRQIVPVGSNRGPAPTDVPPDIAADYAEASLVLALSPKASAALSRRCLQSVLRDAGYQQKDLSQQIDAALAETDTRKALPSGVHTIVDAVRNFGNFSAHKITDQTSLQVIDVELHEAEYCLDILDAVFDHYYVRPAQAQRMKDALNAKLAAAKKPVAK